MKLSKTIFGFAIVATLSFSTDHLSAQWSAISGSVDRTLGNSYARSRHHGDGVAVASSTHAYTRTRIDNSIRIFGIDVEGGQMSTEVYNNNRTGTRRASLVVSAGGDDVRNERYGGSFSRNVWNWDGKLFPIDPQITVMIGFFPVTVAANAGVLLRTNVSLTLWPSSNEVRTGGQIYATVYGAARVLIGFSFAGAGVEARLEFGRTELNLGIVARPYYTDGLSQLTFTAIALKVVAFVNLFVRLGEVTLVEVTGPQWRISKLLRP